MTRRSFLVAGSALSAAAALARESRPMQFHLSCGAIGVKASQREAIDYAAKYGFDAVDADG